MTSAPLSGVFGVPPAALLSVPADAVQLSPLMPGSDALSSYSGAFHLLAVLAPPGTVERRYTLALALRALAAGGTLIALAPKDKGGARLRAELSAFGAEVAEESRRHYRICRAVRPSALVGIEPAIAAGEPFFSERLGLWTQPGVFSHDRVDPGSALLLDHLPPLAGRGADFGCGVGVLARALLASDRVERLSLVDIDRRAIEAAGRNIADARAAFRWADVRNAAAIPGELDFVVTNPPFHDGGTEDRALGAAFIERAASCLRRGGSLWLVANRHLPYEAVLRRQFANTRLVVENAGYKIYEARK